MGYNKILTIKLEFLFTLYYVFYALMIWYLSYDIWGIIAVLSHICHRLGIMFQYDVIKLEEKDFESVKLLLLQVKCPF